MLLFMEIDSINKKYWSTVEPENILSGLCLPEEELFKLLEPNSKILDVGCGNAKVAEYLYEKGYEITGIDINKTALQENRENNRNISFIEADITDNLPFSDSTFDAVVVPYVFVSIINDEEGKRAANELIRVLKTNGILWICEATFSEDYKERYKIGKELTGLDSVSLSFSKEIGKQNNIERVIRHYSEKEIELLFEPLHKLFSKQIAVVSPNSGMTVQTIVSVFRKV